MKHDLFSQYMILEGEDPADFNKLHSDLREYHQPKGSPEDLTVVELATVFWRKRRLLAAETAMIARSPGFVGFNSQPNPDLPHQSSLRGAIRDGAAVVPAKVHLLLIARKKLVPLLKEIKTCGFDPVRNLETADEIYDTFEFHSEGGAFRKLIELSYRAAHPETCEREMSKEDLTNEAIKIISADLFRIEELLTEANSKDVVYSSLVSLVPLATHLDLIIRYETHLDRKLDRLLNRLASLKRARQGMGGKPVATEDSELGS